MNYEGITYPLPKFLQNVFIWNLWKKNMCSKGYHLLDECKSFDAHYLNCDACDLMINIKSFDKTYVKDN